MEEDFSENENFDYNNGNIEKNNERYKDNINKIYNPIENNINNIQSRMINENINQISQNMQGNLPFNLMGNLNQIQEPNMHDIPYPPQNPIMPNLNPNIIVPNFNPSYIPGPNGMPFLNAILLVPMCFNNQFPAQNYLNQGQIIPNMPPPYFDQKLNLIPMSNNKNIEGNNINQINMQDNSNNNIIIFLPDYKSDMNFRYIYFPDIRNKILIIAKNCNYHLTKEEERVLFDDFYIMSNDTIFINEYLFYSPCRISLYAPHIIRGRNDIVSLLLPKKLFLSDFQFSEFYKKFKKIEKIENFEIENDLYLKTLENRIQAYNNGVNYNEKIFGFDFNVNNNYYYLYSAIDDDIISNKLKENKNEDYFDELTFEEFIVYKILERLENKYELLPRILFYEYYLTLNGERVIFSSQVLPGFSDFDYVIYSKCDCIYNKDETPLIIKERYRHNGMEKEIQLEIKSDTLYFFEFKSSLGDNFLEKLFRKYSDFVNLYKAKSWISDKTRIDLMLISDNYRNDLIYNKYGNIIKQFLEENKECSLNLVYSKKICCFPPQSLDIKKYNEVINENEKLKRKIDKLNQKLNKLNEKSENI